MLFLSSLILHSGRYQTSCLSSLLDARHLYLSERHPTSCLRDTPDFWRNPIFGCSWTFIPYCASTVCTVAGNPTAAENPTAVGHPTSALLLSTLSDICTCRDVIRRLFAGHARFLARPDIWLVVDTSSDFCSCSTLDAVRRTSDEVVSVLANFGHYLWTSNSCSPEVADAPHQD